MQEIIEVDELDIVDENGLHVSQPSVGTHILVETDLRNNLSIDQKFIYIVQVKDSQGVTVQISWMGGTLPAGTHYTVAQAWLGEREDRYNVEVFVWDSLSNPVSLAAPKETVVRVHD
jgi:hypothetical protein